MMLAPYILPEDYVHQAKLVVKDSNQAIGISTYKLTENLPSNYKGLLPTADEIEENIKILFDGDGL